MTSRNPTHKRVITAAMTAGFLILVFGLTYRMLATHLSAPVSTRPIDPAALDRLPMQIGDWTGQGIRLDDAETIMRKIRADSYVNRRYSRHSDAESVSLFVAASGVTGGTLIGHGPEVCNVYSGYTAGRQRSVELLLDDGAKLPCKILQFSRSGLSDKEQKTVLYYYVADGHFCGSRSALRYKVRRGTNMVRCVAQVQIASSSIEQPIGDSAKRLASEFAVDSAPAIADLFEHIANDRSADSHHKLQEGK